MAWHLEFEAWGAVKSRGLIKAGGNMESGCLGNGFPGGAHPRFRRLQPAGFHSGLIKKNFSWDVRLGLKKKTGRSW